MRECFAFAASTVPRALYTLSVLSHMISNKAQPTNECKRARAFTQKALSDSCSIIQTIRNGVVSLYCIYPSQMNESSHSRKCARAGIIQCFSNYALARNSWVEWKRKLLFASVASPSQTLICMDITSSKWIILLLGPGQHGYVFGSGIGSAGKSRYQTILHVPGWILYKCASCS